MEELEKKMLKTIINNLQISSRREFKYDSLTTYKEHSVKMENCVQDACRMLKTLIDEDESEQKSGLS